MNYEYKSVVENAFHKSYCAYAHEVAGAVIFIGYGSLADSVRSGRHPYWAEVVRGHPVRVGILYWFEFEATARGYALEAIAHFRPVVNMHTKPMSEGAQRCAAKMVRCVETGTTYPSISAAARSINVTPAAISFLLAGKARSVKGFSFEFV